MSTEHTFTMDLMPSGDTSCVLLDGEDISHLLVGVEIVAGVGTPTSVRLIPSQGKRVVLTARLPEANITIEAEG